MVKKMLEQLIGSPMKTEDPTSSPGSTPNRILAPDPPEMEEIRQSLEESRDPILLDALTKYKATSSDRAHGFDRATRVLSDPTLHKAMKSIPPTSEDPEDEAA